MPLDADEAGVLEEDLKEAAATEAGASTKKTTPGQPRAKIREFEFRTLQNPKKNSKNSKARWSVKWNKSELFRKKQRASFNF